MYRFKSFLTGITLLIFGCFGGLPNRVFAQPTSLSRPKLVVGIVVDQMRWDYLYRYYNRYGNDGFKRLLNEGFSCENTFINYVPSYTAVGHSTIFTGSVPAIHGIVGNEWIDQTTGKSWYCTQDDSVNTVGAPGDAGKMSPHWLLTTTITDELRLATNFQSRVVGISLKDRAAILPAGHSPTAAFWLDDASGHFITSTYYMQDLPEWVKQFNARNEPQKLMSKPWTPLYPIQSYTASTADNEPWEGKFSGEQSSAFPHDLPAIYAHNHEILRSTPFGNTLTLDFARAAVEGYQLGRGTATDFLTINCASTDYVGHMYGPNSVEIEDTYLRLDRDLADFFHFLDQYVGKGNYLVFLTADHGVAHTIGFMQAHHLPADFLQAGKITQALNAYLEQQFGVSKLVISLMNEHVNFNDRLIAEHQLNEDSLIRATIRFLRQQPGIEMVTDLRNIGEKPIPQPIRDMLINGYYAPRTGPIAIVPDPGWFAGHPGGTGTTHGSWNPYDTHIPLIFMGWHIPHGVTHQVVYMTDIAPTLAALLHIQMPNGCVGKPIVPVLGQ
ncbi:type I phosphodiesterase/nucleotide pyrophosphatase [Thermoflavifilum aggregans]|uniref:Type I phosphodiesterase/nucleotide pyrophosphatase n=1 Tax=Thermoflavifilum aggregans TaxID=454188 RepID=A0A2M9CUI3_9BACT|nr:alkaline phosphatase PafA [Thermoflavifilum aggregans]PJJ75553.1 type I phosphodiesterase/nucleotide pyrophosphatase [Thermoflavifilum aggregans]